MHRNLSNFVKDMTPSDEPESSSTPESKADGTDSIACTSEFDFQRLYEVTKVVTRNLNKVIDVNFTCQGGQELQHAPSSYRTWCTGSTDLLLSCTCLSVCRGLQANKDIFETIYFGAMEASMELAELGSETFKGSPASEGKFQFTYVERAS